MENKMQFCYGLRNDVSQGINKLIIVAEPICRIKVYWLFSTLYPILGYIFKGGIFKLVMYRYICDAGNWKFYFFFKFLLIKLFLLRCIVYSINSIV